MYVWQKHRAMDSINYYDARSTGAESYQLLAEEVIHRGDEEWQKRWSGGKGLTLDSIWNS